MLSQILHHLRDFVIPMSTTTSRQIENLGHFSTPRLQYVTNLMISNPNSNYWHL